MPKTKKDQLSSWIETIKKIGDEEIEKNNKLTPSKYSLDNIVGCARTIHEHTVLMKNVSDMAHQGLMAFDMAQKILNGTKLRIKETVGYMEAYLGLNDKEGK